MSPHAARFTALALLAAGLCAPQPALHPAPTADYAWGIKKFFNEQGNNMNQYFQQQKAKVEEVLAGSYRDAARLGETVQQYVEMADEVGESVAHSGRQLADTFSYEERAPSAAERLADPGATLSVAALVLRHGYPCETHALLSRGYVLSVHRVPRALHAAAAPAVILQHGLFASSADWVLAGPGRALAYVLADAGYDVWMPNVRGNQYSREHTDLRTDSKAYWNFSWHDAAVHDLPAVIDYIRRLKGPRCQLAYVGHSMGTTLLFAMLSSRPDYNSALAGALALAPVGYMAGVRGPVRALAPLASNVAYMEMMYGEHEFIPKTSSLGSLASACRGGGAGGAACKSAIFSLCGSDEGQLDAALLPAFLAHLGTGTSWKTVVHFAQEIQAEGRFQHFDYGAHHNKRLYGSEVPPEYDLSKITLPIKLFWAQNDLLSSERDVRALHARLPRGSELYRVPDAQFNHLDYLWARDAPRLLNQEVLRSLGAAFDRDASSKDRDASSKDRDAASKDRDASSKDRDASSKDRDAANKNKDAFVFRIW